MDEPVRVSTSQDIDLTKKNQIVHFFVLVELKLGFAEIVLLNLQSSYL